MRIPLLAVVLASCTPAASNAVIEVRPVTSTVATLPPSASSSPEQRVPVGKAPMALPFMPEQIWIGRYLCPQGETALVLRIERVEGRDVHAIFDFRYVPQAVEGSFEISGKWDPGSHSISFSPGQWLEQPSGYVPVGMTGVVSGAMFEGKIDNPSCGDFSLVLNNDEDWD